MSLINQMLKDIDKRQALSQNTSSVIPEIRGVMKSKFHLYLVMVGILIATSFGVAAYLILKDNISPQHISLTEPATIVLSDIKSLKEISPLILRPNHTEITAEPQAMEIPNPKIDPVILTELEFLQKPIIPYRSDLSHRDDLVTLVKKELTREQKSEDSYRNAVENIRLNRMTEAQKNLSDMLEFNPLHHAGRLLSARVMADTGQLGEATKLLNEGIVIAPNEAEFFMSLANVFLINNDLIAAIKTMTAGESVSLENAEYQAYFASLLQRSGLHDEAIHHLVKALKKSPDTANWLLSLGISLQYKNEVISASQAYERAMDLGLSPELMKFAHDRHRQVTP